jgi:hypothetical protein
MSQKSQLLGRVAGREFDLFLRHGEFEVVPA